MQTTPNLGLTIPSSDQDPFDELVFVTALTTIDTWSATVAPLASPALTGTPTAPSPATGDSSTKIATTFFVKAQAYATLASPALTGTPTAPTPASGDNSTTIATTAFVKNQGYLTSFNGRTAQAVVPTAGDYTAAMVTNAADKSSAATQSFTGGIVSTSPTAGVGYGAGAGGFVTQATSKSTGVTLNKTTGTVIMAASALAAGASVSFFLTNSAIGTSDVVVANLVSGFGTTGTYQVNVLNTGTASVNGGGVRIQVTNISAGSLSESLQIGFAVIKGSLT